MSTESLHLPVTTDLDRSQHQSVVTHCTSKAKVTQFDNTILAEQDVLWLHITMQDTPSMEVVQGRY